MVEHQLVPLQSVLLSVTAGLAPLGTAQEYMFGSWPARQGEDARSRPSVRVPSALVHSMPALAPSFQFAIGTDMFVTRTGSYDATEERYTSATVVGDCERSAIISPSAEK